MECDQCGARRPRTGPCPTCGAPPPGTYSSLRQWKDQARTGKNPAYGSGSGSGRGSGANWGARASNPQGGRGSGAGWQPEYDEDLDDQQGYAGGRSPRGASGYDEMDLERALVPTRDEMLPMGQSAAGMPMVPGIGTSDDEERMLGIRRPVYIPATGDRRKRKLGTFRVVSGVASIMLVCIVSCGLAGLFGHDRISTFIGGPRQGHQTIPTANSTIVAKTPMAIFAPQNKFVQSVVTATAVDANYVPINPTTRFVQGASVYVVVYVRHIPKGQQHTVSVRWYLQNQDVGLTIGSALNKTVSADSNVFFTLQYPVSGLGTARIFVDRPDNDTNDPTIDPHLAATIYFAITSPAAATPSASAGKTPASKTPSPSTSPHALHEGGSGDAQVAWREQAPLS